MRQNRRLCAWRQGCRESGAVPDLAGQHGRQPHHYGGGSGMGRGNGEIPARPSAAYPAEAADRRGQWLGRAGAGRRDAPMRGGAPAKGRQRLDGDGHSGGGGDQKQAGKRKAQEKCALCGGKCADALGAVRLFQAGLSCAYQFPRRHPDRWTFGGGDALGGHGISGGTGDRITNRRNGANA